MVVVFTKHDACGGTHDRTLWLQAADCASAPRGSGQLRHPEVRQHEVELVDVEHVEPGLLGGLAA